MHDRHGVPSHDGDVVGPEVLNLRTQSEPWVGGRAGTVHRLGHMHVSSTGPRGCAAWQAWQAWRALHARKLPGIPAVART